MASSCLSRGATSASGVTLPGSIAVTRISEGSSAPSITGTTAPCWAAKAASATFGSMISACVFMPRSISASVLPPAWTSAAKSAPPCDLLERRLGGLLGGEAELLDAPALRLREARLAVLVFGRDLHVGDRGRVGERGRVGLEDAELAVFRRLEALLVGLEIVFAASRLVGRADRR